MDYNLGKNTIDKVNVYNQEKGLTLFECEYFGKKVCEYKNRNISDFQAIFDDVSAKMEKISNKYCKAYEDDIEMLKLEKAVKKGKSILTTYKSFYLEEEIDSNKKIFIMSEYYEFNQQYNEIKTMLD